VSRRTLTRRFTSAIGMAPGEWLQRAPPPGAAAAGAHRRPDRDLTEARRPEGPRVRARLVAGHPDALRRVAVGMPGNCLKKCRRGDSRAMARSRKPQRSLWTGSVSFGLVNVRCACTAPCTSTSCGFSSSTPRTTGRSATRRSARSRTSRCRTTRSSRRSSTGRASSCT
jgi:hypothetical protein